MKAIQTDQLSPGDRIPSVEKHWIYNGLDCAVTLEVFHHIEQQLDNLSGATYAFERDLQGPILDMNLRGILVDQEARRLAIFGYQQIVDRLAGQLERILREGL